MYSCYVSLEQWFPVYILDTLCPCYSHDIVMNSKAEKNWDLHFLVALTTSDKISLYINENSPFFTSRKLVLPK